MKTKAFCAPTCGGRAFRASNPSYDDLSKSQAESGAEALQIDKGRVLDPETHKRWGLSTYTPHCGCGPTNGLPAIVFPAAVAPTSILRNVVPMSCRLYRFDDEGTPAGGTECNASG